MNSILSNSFIVASLLLVMQSGCFRQPHGPERAAVEGSVTLNGQPLSQGVIQFIPQSPTQGPAASAAVVNGHFELPRHSGPVVGTHRIEIRDAPERLPNPDDQAAVKKYLAAKKRRKKRQTIPNRYNTASELTAKIDDESGQNLKFELVSRQ